MPLADRATISNMAPEYGATCGFFPIDDISLEYLRLTGRDEEQIRVVEEYCKANGLFYTADSKDPIYTDLVEIDLNTIESNLSGPETPTRFNSTFRYERCVPQSCCSTSWNTRTWI